MIQQFDRASPERILRREVASIFEIKEHQLIGRNRAREYVIPRQLLCYVLRERWPDLSYYKIAALVGGRDHSTILHSINKAKQRIKGDDLLRRRAEGLIAFGKALEPRDAHVRSWAAWIARCWLKDASVEWAAPEALTFPARPMSFDDEWRLQVIADEELGDQCAERQWCAQCDRAVTAAASVRCSDRFCSLKVQPAMLSQAVG